MLLTSALPSESPINVYLHPLHFSKTVSENFGISDELSDQCHEKINVARVMKTMWNTAMGMERNVAMYHE